jgi:transposase
VTGRRYQATRAGFILACRKLTFNAVTFERFLRRLWRVAAPSRRLIVVIADNAKYHHARLHADWRHQHAERFSLDFLPPYSPELNPIERVWKLTRRLCLHNRYFPILEMVIEAVEHQFAVWRHGSDALRRLCAIT